MKKTFLFGMIALLSVSFIFMSCPQEAEEPEFTDVSASFPLATNDSNIETIGQPTNLDITAKKSTKDGTIYITLKSKTALTGTSDFADSGLWGGKREQAPEGKWADFALDLSSVFTTENAAKILSVKSTNHAYRYYKGAANIWAAAPTVPTRGDPNIYIPSSSETELPVKWKIYAANTFSDDASQNWGIIIWDSAPAKVITFELREHETLPSGSGTSTGTSASDPADLASDAGTLLTKIVIDYSGVVIE